MHFVVVAVVGDVVACIFAFVVDVVDVIFCCAYVLELRDMLLSHTGFSPALIGMPSFAFLLQVQPSGKGAKTKSVRLQQ